MERFSSGANELLERFSKRDLDKPGSRFEKRSNSEDNSMKHPTAFLVLSAMSLAACASITGTYTPACIAYEGNTIELSDGRFVWDKFTDEVSVDDAGNVIDPFPGFPVQGSYSIDEDVVRLSTDVGELMAEMYLVRNSGRVHLLTADQFEAWRKDRELDECALTLGATGDG